MADRWAVATGNWSNTATWNGGTLPGAGDDVYADGYTVTIDQAITVLSIRTTQRSGGTAGGQFTLGGNHNVTADCIAGTTDCLSATSRTFTLVGNATGGSVSSADGVLVNASTMTMTGDATGSVGAGVNIVNALSNATITGDVTGSEVSGLAGHGITIAAGTLAITGTVTGGSRGSGINSTGSGTKTITVNGDVYASTATRQSTNIGGIFASEVGTITINGTVYASTTHAAIINTGTATIEIEDAVDGSNGYSAYVGPVLFESSSTASHKVRITGGTEITLEVGGGTSRAISPFYQGVIG